MCHHLGRDSRFKIRSYTQARYGSSLHTSYNTVIIRLLSTYRITHVSAVVVGQVQIEAYGHDLTQTHNAHFRSAASQRLTQRQFGL